MATWTDPRFIEVAQRWAKRYPYGPDQILYWRLNWGKWRYVLAAIECSLISGRSPDAEFSSWLNQIARPV